MSDSTRIEKLREEIEKLCGNCDRPDKEELGKIILSSMTFGFSEGLKAPSADRPSATEIMNAYHEGVRKGIAEAYGAYGADRPQGEWMSPTADSYIQANFYKCSICGKVVNMFQMRNYNYCPNCGARMKGADDETD